VELHGGSVTATSPGRDRGTTVTVRLPTCRPPAAFDPGPLTPVGLESPKRSVLLIEDNADARLMLRTVLAHEGHTVHEAADGPTGVAAALATRPDIAFVDLDLPGFDGYEVVRRLREAPEARKLRMIALSGYGGAEVRQRALYAGFDDHLVKPIEPDRLTALLRDTGRD
jgi:CheY-like chemotaxis protein